MGQRRADLGSYGRSFADVYDAWYSDVSDVEATVERIASLAGAGRVLELGVGTGRLALPLAHAGVAITGIDASIEMLDALRTKDGTDRALVALGDMAELPFIRSFSVVL